MARGGQIPSECIEMIREIGSILGKFRNFSESRSVIYVALNADRQQTYISRIQGMHGDNALLIDPLMPPEGNELIGGGGSIAICCTGGGLRYEFETTLIGVVKGEMPAFVLDLPTKIRCIVARQHPRVSFLEEAAIPVRIMQRTDTTVSVDGAAVQLGVGGMGVIVPSSMGWETGTKIEKLMFALPSGQVIRAAATVRSGFPLYRTDGSIRGYRCNLQFVKLERRYSSTLEAFVFRRQLETSTGDMAAAA